MLGSIDNEGRGGQWRTKWHWVNDTGQFNDGQGLKPNTHRRRDETVLSRRVGVGGVYMNSQLAHDDCRWIRRCERSRWP